MTPCPICQKPVDALRARHVGVRDGKIVAYCSAECQARAAAMGPGAVAASAAAAVAVAAAEAAVEPAPAAQATKKGRTPAAGVKATRSPSATVKAAEPPADAAPPAAREPVPRITPTALAAAAVEGAPGETVTDDPSASTIRKRRRRKDSIEARAAWEWLDDEPAEEVAAGRTGEGEEEGRRGGRRALVIALVLAALGGGGYLAYRYGYLPGAGGGGAAPADAAPADAVADAGLTPEQQRQSALDRATSLLRAQAGAAPAEAGKAGSAAEAGKAGSAAEAGKAGSAAEAGKAGSAAEAGKAGSAAEAGKAGSAAEAGKAGSAAEAGKAGSAADGRAGPQVLTRRMAVAALSRTGDAAAIAILAGLLEKEPSESARLEISYQLARAGDPRGTEKLVAALASRNLDSRHEAARWLARLGDQRAVPVLTAAMAYAQFRLPAAEVLAYVAHPGAIKFLEETRASATATAEEKARAAIALGRAKRATADELLALLADKRNAEAAPVLAELGNPAAKPILQEQLAFEHSCVEAARALRRFGDETDRADGLRTLLSALGGDGATAQIRAAEAILLLAGPASWSEKM